MSWRKIVVLIVLQSVCGGAAFSQLNADILSSYHKSVQLYRDDFNGNETARDNVARKITYNIENGLLNVYSDYWYGDSFTLPARARDYQMEVECNFSTKGYYPMVKSDVNKDETMTLVFDGVMNNNHASGTYVSMCVMTQYSDHSKSYFYNYGYLSIGRQDGTVFTELKKYRLDLDEVNDFHKVKVAAIGDSYYYYYDDKFIGKLLKADANPDHYADNPKNVYYTCNGGFYLSVNYFTATALEENQTKDITPPSISLLTPVDDGNGIAEDDNGKIMVSGRVTDISGVAWVKLNGQDIGSVQANGYFSFNASSLSNNIIIQACDKVGNIGSKSFSFNIIRDNLIHIPIIPVDQPPAFHAVIIACSKYLDPGKNIPETISEANALRTALMGNYGFSDKNIHMILDGSYDLIVSTVRSVMSRMQANDNLLITFSGHGTFNQDKTNPVGYWITGSGTDYDHGYISSEQLKSMLTETDCKAKHVLVLSDACYSGAFKDVSLTHMSYSERTAYNYSSTKVMTSCGFDKSPATSVFMANVIKALNDNATIYKSKYLSDIGIYGLIARAVVAGSGNEPNIFNFGQHGNEGGNFYFILKP